MPYQPTSGAPPSDAQTEATWNQIMQLARAHALIVSAYGGVATLAVPAEQRKAGIRNKTLRAELYELESETQS